MKISPKTRNKVMGIFYSHSSGPWSDSVDGNNEFNGAYRTGHDVAFDAPFSFPPLRDPFCLKEKAATTGTSGGNSLMSIGKFYPLSFLNAILQVKQGFYGCRRFPL